MLLRELCILPCHSWVVFMSRRSEDSIVAPTEFTKGIQRLQTEAAISYRAEIFRSRNQLRTLPLFLKARHRQASSHIQLTNGNTRNPQYACTFAQALWICSILSRPDRGTVKTTVNESGSWLSVVGGLNRSVRVFQTASYTKPVSGWLRIRTLMNCSPAASHAYTVEPRDGGHVAWRGWGILLSTQHDLSFVQVLEIGVGRTSLALIKGL